MRIPQQCFLTILIIIVTCFLTVAVIAQAASLPDESSRRFKNRWPGQPYPSNFDDENYDDQQPLSSRGGGSSPWIFGTGREFSLFGSSPSSRSSDNNKEELGESDDDEDDDDDRRYNHDSNVDSDRPEPLSRTANANWKTSSDHRSIYSDRVDSTTRFPSHTGTTSPFHRAQLASSNGGRIPPPFEASPPPFSSSSYNYYNNKKSNRNFNKKPRAAKRSQFFLQPVTDWWTSNISPNIKSWPKLHIRVEPTTTLKLRKTFRPLGTIVRLGANFNTQLAVWQFHSSWEDAIIGGKLTLAGRELQLTKSWQLSVGAMEDLVTRLRFRAAVDLSTWKAYARVGFRTERLSPINVMEGFTVQKQVPLDGPAGHVKLQVKANLRLPEPEIEYSTETQRSLIGMGDIQVNIEELNLLLDY